MRRDVLHDLARHNNVEFAIDFWQKVIDAELGSDNVGAPHVELQVFAAGFDEGSHAATEIKYFEPVRRALCELVGKQHEPERL